VISIKKLNFSYDKQKVINDLDFDIQENEVYGIIGPNGSGKTTILKILTRILKIDSGDITLNSKDLNGFKVKEFAKNVSVVHQIEEYEVGFKVEQVIQMGRNPYLSRFQNMSDTDKLIVEKAMILTDTITFRDRLMSELSGGERQRVFIARAIAQETKVLILDEPINHLDIYHQIEILKLIRLLAKEHNKTVIITLHDLNMSVKFCDKLLILNNGKCIVKGVPKEIITKEVIKEVYNINVNLEHDSYDNLILIPEY
jgi:iron complex transport system ATP-binding protein